MATHPKQSLMDEALAVKRGEVRLADISDTRREEVRKFLRKTPEREFRAEAMKRREEARRRPSADARATFGHVRSA